MLLAIDIGNTNTVFGLFEQQQLKAHWRIRTDRQKTADEYGIICLQLLQFYQINPLELTAAVIVSVVPTVGTLLSAAVETFFNLNPLTVHYRLKTGLKLLYDQPEQLGADRLVNAAAAYFLYGGPVIIIDLGTATKFCVVSACGEYLGGIIAPGIKSLAETLSNSADQLPRFELAKPPTVIGTNTLHCMQSGIINGQIAMITGLIQQIKTELNLSKIKVVATGGLANLIASTVPDVDTINPYLTLEGLQLIYQMNREWI
ncbi:MAG TPA: type III pantothenate kinase [Bacillota bacterium]